MNNIALNKIAKAGFVACLFLCLHTSASSQQWSFNPATLAEYRSVLNLTSTSAPPTGGETTVGKIYVASLAEALELLITEDHTNFDLYEQRFEQRLKQKLSGSPELLQFTLAEMHLHWAFVYLKFGHEFDAASHLHEANKIAQKCKRKYPKFLAVRKTTGLLEIMLGSVPEKYSWLLSVLGMKGSVTRGLADLEIVIKEGGHLAQETRMLKAIVDGFVLQKPESAMIETENLVDENPDSRSMRLLAAVMAIKNSKSEQAIRHLDELNFTSGLPLDYSFYLQGELMLYKGEYDKAIKNYELFLAQWKGSNYTKDSYFKIGVCHHLLGHQDQVKKYFDLARESGLNNTEADRSAERSLNDSELPNVPLSKARYAMDGGYYDAAFQILSSINDREIPTKRDQVEYYYRKARLEHKTGHLPAAKLFYRQTIDMAGDKNWYFAPNACLQLGYILASENNMREAQHFFEKAISYQHHEYKNSIDAKAKSALGEIK